LRRLTLGLAALSAGLFAALVVMAKGWLEPVGLAIFDSRLMRYGVGEAQTYLDGLSDEARELYAGPFQAVDAVFPLVLTVTLVLAVWRFDQLSGQRGWVRVLGFLLALGYCVADLLENAAVREVLVAEPPLSADLVHRLSVLTQVKWALLVIAAATVWSAWRGAQRKARA